MNRPGLSARLAPWAPSLALLAALAAGAFIGLALLATEWGLAGPGPQSALGQVGKLLLPLAGMGLLVVVGMLSPLAALTVWLVLAPYSAHIPLDISLGSGVPDLSLTRVMAGALLLLVLAQAVRGQRPLHSLTWPDRVYILFGGAMMLSAFRSMLGTANAAQSVFDVYLVPFVGLYLARQVVRNRRDLNWIMAAAMLIGAGLAFLIIREQITGEILLNSQARPADYSASFRKVQSLLGNAAPMGVATALCLPLGLLALLQVVQQRQNRRAGDWLLVLGLAIANGWIALGVFMTYNRASWLGILFAVLIPLLMRPQARRLLLPVVLVAALLAAVYWQSVVTSPAVTERLLEERSIDYRTTAATLAFQMARGSPWIGIGYNNFDFVASSTYGWDPIPSFSVLPPAHNSYLFVLVAGGATTLLPYLAWLGLVALAGLRYFVERRSRDLLAVGLALFLTYGLASGTFDNAQTGYMNLIFYTMLGAVWGVLDREGEASRVKASPSRAVALQP